MTPPVPGYVCRRTPPPPSYLPHQNPSGHSAFNGLMLHDFMGLGTDRCDDFNHAEYAPGLHQAQLHNAQGSTFGHTQQLGVDIHLENRHITMDLLSALEKKLQLGVCLEDRSHITSMDEDVPEVDFDLELRLGVHHPKDRNSTTAVILVESVRQAVEEVQQRRVLPRPHRPEEILVEPVRQAIGEVQQRQVLPRQILPCSPSPVLPAKDSPGVGVWYNSVNWDAFLVDPTQSQGKWKIELGTYNSSDEAKRAHDKAAIKLNALRGEGQRLYPLNFPESDYADYMQQHSDWSVRDFIWKLRRELPTFTRGSSTMKGVSVITRVSSITGVARVTYLVQISWTDSNGKQHREARGGFTSEVQAGRFYDAVLLILTGDDDVTNFRPGSYSAAEIDQARQWLAAKYPNQNFASVRPRRTL